MAEVNVPALFDSLGQKIIGLQAAISAQGVTADIKPFSGNPKEFKDWTKSIEKHARLHDLTEDRIKLVAFQTSRDSVSDYLDRLLSSNPGYNWARVKGELAVRFAEVSDKQHAFSLLQKIKQKKDESVPVFGERVLSLAMQAYDNIDAPEVQRQLVIFFVDGLFHDYVRIKVLREDPEDFQAAVTCGMTEFNFRKRVDLRTEHDFYSASR